MFGGIPGCKCVSAGVRAAAVCPNMMANKKRNELCERMFH